MKIWTKEEEAEKLAARFDGVNRAKFAREHNVGGGGPMIYQHMTGRRPMNLEAAIAYANGFKCSLAEISPRLAAEAAAANAVSGAPAYVSGQQNDKESNDDAVVVVTNAIASMGLGHPQAEYDQVVDTIRLTRSWVHGNLPKLSAVDNLAILTAYGDSMSPTFADGDLLLVDRGINQIKLDAVYVIARDGELFVKRVRRRLQDGAVVIKSDNPLFGPDDIIENGERAQLDVLGRVVWAWSGKRL